MKDSSIPLISMVLPVYNGSRHLAASIESCLRQTYPNWELVIVDDASTDGTPDIIDAYCRQDGRVRSVRNPVNVKLPVSLNRGFDRARGSLFSWTSDDNEYLPEALAEMARGLVRRPRIDMVYADMMLMGENGQDLRRSRRPRPARLGFRGNVVGGCFLYRREIAEKIGPYPADLFLVEDYYYWLRLADLGRLFHIPRILYRYRVHAQSLSGRHANRRGIGRLALERALQKTRRRVLQAGIHCNLAMDDWEERDYTRARANLSRALRLAPGAVIVRGFVRRLGAILLGRRPGAK